MGSYTCDPMQTCKGCNGFRVVAYVIEIKGFGPEKLSFIQTSIRQEKLYVDMRQEPIHEKWGEVRNLRGLFFCLEIVCQI